MNIQIKNRFNGAVLFECELPPEIAALSAPKKLGYAVKEALKARANLTGAYLTGAYLTDAYGTPAAGMPKGWRQNGSGLWVKT